MALASAIISYDLADYTGNDFDARRTRVWVSTNIPGETVVDTAGNKIRLGCGSGAIGDDGTGSVSVWIPGAGANPTTWQTTIHVDYPDRHGRATRSFGPFTITGDANLADLVAELPVQPEYLSDVLDRLDALEADSGTGDALVALAAEVHGYTNLGNISGAVTVQPVGTQRCAVTATTTITIPTAGHADGESFTLLIRSGGDNVSWANSIGFDAGEPTGDVISVTFLKVDGYWTSLSGATAGEVVTPVTDPPTQPGTVTVTPTSDGYNLSWVASTVAAGYEAQLDGGAWVDSGSNLTHTHTGLAAGSTHSGAVRAYNSTGSRSTSRTWGPSDTLLPGLHEQLLAYNAPLYFRANDAGQYEDHSSVPHPLSEWNLNEFSAQSGAVPATFNGPAVGNVSKSIYLGNKSVMRNKNGDFSAFNGMTEWTGVAMIPGGAPAYYEPNISLHGAFSFPANRGTLSNTVMSNDATIEHLIVWRWVAGQNSDKVQVYRDGVLTTYPDFALHTPIAVNTTDSDNKGLWIGDTNKSYSDPPTFTRVTPFVFAMPSAIPVEDIVALAQAAGTYGNPK